MVAMTLICQNNYHLRDNLQRVKGNLGSFAFTWEQRKLGDTLSSLQNNTLSRAELCPENGAAKNVHYGDVLIKFGEYLDISKEELPMIADSSVVAKYKASYLKNGDVVIADTAEDETVGKCSEIAGLRDEIVISGLHTIPYRPQLNFASGYLGYYMNSDSYCSAGSRYFSYLAARCSSASRNSPGEYPTFRCSAPDCPDFTYVRRGTKCPEIDLSRQSTPSEADMANPFRRGTLRMFMAGGQENER